MIQKDTVFLDYNATTPLKDEVKVAMLNLMGKPLNPSSVHSFGRGAKSILTKSRNKITESLGADGASLIFTSSGTEANNLAMNCLKDVSAIMISEIEHISVIKPVEKLAEQNTLEIKKIPVDEKGLINKVFLKNQAEEFKARDIKFLTSIILANNETGIIQNINDIAPFIYENGGYLHVDASQAMGKINFDFNSLNVDMATISAHKIGGPLGAAGLMVKSGLAIEPFLTGGGQEKYLRAGTENLPAISGFAKSVELAANNVSKYQSHCKSLIAKFEDSLINKYPDSVIFSQIEGRLPNTSCFAIPGKKSETQLINLDLKGFALSSGSACSSGRVSTSHVLTAMGYSKEISECAIRLSVGIETSESDIQRLIDIL